MLLLHVVIVAIVAILAAGAWPAAVLMILVTTHLIMDAIKLYLLSDSLRSFALDPGGSP